jgi:tetratricopeptide (TPR) repeat protein
MDMTEIRERLNASDYDQFVREIVDDWPDFNDEIESLAGDDEFFVGLAMELERMAERSSDPGQEADTLTAYGDILAQRIGLERKAVKAYRNAFQVDQSNRRSLERARDIYRENDNHQRVALLYQLELKGLDDEEARNDIRLRMAHLYAEFLGDADKAVGILDDVSDDGEFAELAERLEKLYRDGQRLSDGVERIIDQAEKLVEEGESSEAASMFERAAELEDISERSSETGAKYREKAQKLSGDAANLRETQKLETTETGPASAGSGTVEDATSESNQQHGAMKPTRQMGAIDLEEAPNEDDKDLTELHLSGWDERPLQQMDRGDFNDKDEALDELEDNPADIEALAAAAQDMVELGQYRPLSDRLEKSLRYLRGEEGEKEVTIELGHLFWQDIGDFERAEEFFNRLKLLDRTHPAMVAFYEAHYAKQQQWRKLFTFLSSQQRRVDDIDDAIEIARRLSDIAENRMKSSERAIGVWKDVLRQHPDNQSAAEQLERLYEEHSKWHALADYLENEVDRLGEDQQEATLETLEKLVPVYRDRLEHNSKLINTLRRILEVDAGHQTAFQELRKHLKEKGRWADLAELLQRRADARDGDIEIELRLEVADIWQERLQNPAKAIPQLSEVLDKQPENDQIRSRLAELLEERHDYDKLYELRRQELNYLDGAARSEALEELVEFVDEKLNDDERLVAVLEEIRDEEPDRLDVVDRLCDNYRRLGQWGDLVETLEDKIRLESDESAQVEALVELGEILEDQCNDREQAAEVYLDILERQPDHDEVLDQLTQIWLDSMELESLTELYRRRDQLQQLAEILDSSAALADDTEMARRFYAFLADLYEHDLENTERAIASLESLLEITDRQVEVANRLRDKYRQTDEVDGELEMNRLLLDSVDDEKRQTEIIGDLVDIAVEHDRAHRVLGWLLQGAVANPSREVFFDRAEKLAKRTDLLDLFVEKAEGLLADIEHQSLQESVWRSLGNILEKRGEYRGAIDYFEKLTERHPASVKLWRRLQSLYRQIDETTNLIDALETEIDLETQEDDTERADLTGKLLQLGGLYRRQNDYDRAEKLFEEVLEYEPENRDAIEGLEELNRARGDYDSVVDYLARQLSLIEDTEKSIALKREIAETYYFELDDPDSALDYFEELVAEDIETSSDVVETLERLQEIDEYTRRASELLEPIYRNQQDSAGLAETFEARLETLSEDTERIELLRKLIELYRHELEDSTRAFELATEWFELDSDNSEVWQLLEDIGASLSRLEEVESRFDEAISEESPTETDLELLERVARIREDELDNPKEALDAWKQLYRERPEDLEVLDALERLFRLLDSHAQLVDTLKAKSRQTEDDEAVIKLQEEIGYLSEDRLGQLGSAKEAYRKILQLDSSHIEALEGLERVLQETNNYEALVDFYDRYSSVVDDTELEARFLTEKGRLQLEEFDNHADAASVLIELVTREPSRREAVEVLEQVEREVRENKLGRQLHYNIVSALEGVYRAHEQKERLVEMLELKSDLTEDRDERVSCFEELAELYERDFNELEKAFEALEQRLQIDPDPEVVRADYERLADELGLFSRVISTYRDARAETQKEAELLKSIARIYRDQLDDPEEAIEAFREAGQLAPGDRQVLDGLEELYRKHGDYNQLVEILERQLETGSVSDRVEVLRQVADIYADHLGQPETAIERYQQLLDIESADIDALKSLEELYEQTGDSAVQLAETLERQIQILDDADERSSKLMKVGRVYEERLDETEQAIEAYRTVLSINSHHIEALESLERLLEAKKDWEELANILRMKLDVDKLDIEVRRQAQLKLGRVLYKHLDSLGRAVDMFERVLETEPEHAEVVEHLEQLLEVDRVAERVADLLEPIYDAGEQWEHMVDLYATRIQHAEPRAAAEYRFQRAQLYRDKLDEPDEALSDFTRALKAKPGSDVIREQLVSLANRQEAWEELRTTYRQILDDEPETELQLDYQKRLADLAVDELDDFVEAETHYRNAISIEPTFEPAYKRLQRLVVEQQRWLDLVELLEQRITREVYEDSEQKRQILTRMAEVQETELNDPYSAADTYRQLIEEDPTNEEASERLERLYRQQDRWEELLDHFETRLTVVTDPEKTVEIQSKMGDILASRMYRPADACEVYRDILEVEPQYQPVIESLEEIFETNPDFKQVAAELLEPIYREREDWSALIDVLCAVERPESPGSGDYFAELEEAANLAETKLGDEERAFRIYTELFEMSPSDRDIRLNLSRLAASTGQWEQLLETYDSTINENFDLANAQRVDLLLEKAEVLEERLEQLDDATEVYDEVLLEEPDNQQALEAMERLLTRKEDWERLADFYRDRAGKSDTEDRVYWLEREATIYDDVLQDIDRSIESYFRLLEENDQNRGAVEALVRLLGHRNRWHDLAELYRRRLANALEPAEQIEYRFELARLQEDELDFVEKAVQNYRKILLEEPGHEESVYALEGLHRDLQNRGADFRRERRDIIELLLSHYDVESDWPFVVELLEQKVDLLAEPRQRVDIYKKLFSMIDQYAESGYRRLRGLKHLARAVSLDPFDQQLIETLHSRVETQRQWDQLLPILISGVEKTDDREQQATLMRLVAEVYASELEDYSSAISLYQQLIEFDGGDEILERLKQLYGHLQMWRPLIDLLEERLESEFDREVRSRLLEQIGQLAEDKLGETDRAIDTFEQLREIRPGDQGVLSRLASLYDSAARYDELADVLREQADVTDDVESKNEKLQRLADVYREQLDRPEDAIETYRESLSLSDSNSVRRDVGQLLEATERWADLLGNLDARIERAQKDDIADLHVKKARIHLSKLQAPSRALESVRHAVEYESLHSDALQLLTDLLDYPDTRIEASEILERVLRDAEAWSRLRDVWEIELAETEDPARIEKLYQKLLELMRSKFDAPEEAFEIATKGMKQLPSSDAIWREGLQLAIEVDEVDTLVGLLNSLSEDEKQNPQLREELEGRLGWIYRDILQKPDKAIEHFETARQIDETAETLLILDELYREQQDWSSLLEILERRYLTPGSGDPTEIAFRLGYLKEVVDEDYERALQLYREVLDKDPEHDGVIEGLERLVEHPECRLEAAERLEEFYRRHEMFGRLSGLLRLKLEVLEDEDTRIEHRRRAAEVEKENLGNLEAAVEHLAEAFRLDPYRESIQNELESVTEEYGFDETIIEVYRGLIEELGDPRKMVELAIEAGSRAKALESYDLAVECFSHVLELEPENRTALDAIEQIARETGDIESLVDVLEHRADLTFEDEKRREILFELAESYEQLDRRDDAIRTLRQILVLDESDEDVLSKLAKLYREEGRTHEYLENLERLIGVVDGRERSIELHEELASQSHENLRDLDRAITHYSRVLELDPEHREAVSKLEELYRETGQWDQLERLLDQQIDETDDSAGLADLYRRKADIAFQELGQADKAVDLYERAIKLNPGHAEVIDALRQVYGEFEAWDELIELLKDQLSEGGIEDWATERQLRLELAKVYVDYGDQLDEAIEQLETVLEVDEADSRALSLLADILEERQEFDELTALLERLEETVEDGQRTREIVQRRANVLAEHLGEYEQASELLKDILRDNPEDAESLESLKSILKEQGDYEGLAEILWHELDIRGDEERTEPTIELEIADIAAQHLDDVTSQVKALEKALDVEPANRKVVDRLLEIYDQEEAYEEAERVLTRAVEAFEDERESDAVVEYKYQLGRIAEERGDEQEAFEIYREIHAIDSKYVPNLLSLGRLAFERDDKDYALNIFQTMLLHQSNIDEPDNRVEMYYYLGRLRQHSEEPSRAKDMFNRALEIDPEHEPSSEAKEELSE